LLPPFTLSHYFSLPLILPLMSRHFRFAFAAAIIDYFITPFSLPLLFRH
jgi:hypothetical protein